MILVAARRRRHLRRVAPRLHGLRARGCDNRNALAVIAAETFFRPAVLRGFEYLVWAVLSLLGSRRVETLSVGLAQVQLRHWRQAGLLEDTRWTPRRFAAVRDPERQYRAALAFLERRGLATETDAERLTRRYTGHDRRHFPELVRGAWDALDRADPPPTAAARAAR